MAAPTNCGPRGVVVKYSPERIVRAIARRAVDSRAWRWLRWIVRRPRPSTAIGPVRLHLGCGTVDLPGFVNIDANPHPHVHFIRDVESPHLWQPGAADLIYASHVLEHVPWTRVPAVLARWRSFLKPGGVLRLSVPDFDALHDYYAVTKDLAWITPPLMGSQCDAYDVHRAVFTRSALEALLRDAGFSEVRDWDAHRLRIGDWSNYTFELEGRTRLLSLNVEAVK
jgi:predicted SAM-dependent methyltransferase